MKLNEKYYRLCQTEPIETQELEEGIMLEIHMMNDNPFFDKVIAGGQFSLWSVDDGNIYKVFLEKGYYEVMKELQTKKINQYWINFFNECESSRKKFVKRVAMPMVFIYAVILLLVSFVMSANGSTNGTTVVLILAIVGTFAMFMFSKKVLTKKADNLNYQVIQRIKKVQGAKNFEALMKKQRQYCVDYFKIKPEMVEEEKE